MLTRGRWSRFELRRLTNAEGIELNASGNEAYEVQNVSPHFVAKAELNLTGGRWLLVAIGSDMLVASGANRAFNRYLLTKQTSVSKSEIENVQLPYGRSSKTTY